MTSSELIALKKGDQVSYTGSFDSLYGIQKGHLLTRSESWMDDDVTVAFKYENQAGSALEHFFGVDDIETKEQ